MDLGSGGSWRAWSPLVPPWWVSNDLDFIFSLFFFFHLRAGGSCFERPACAAQCAVCSFCATQSLSGRRWNVSAGPTAQFPPSSSAEWRTFELLANGFVAFKYRQHPCQKVCEEFASLCLSITCSELPALLTSPGLSDAFSFIKAFQFYLI